METTPRKNLYEKCGFIQFGLELLAVAVGAEFVAKVHMWCEVDLNMVFRAAIPADAERIADVLLASRKTFLPFAPWAHTDEKLRA